MIGDWEKKLDKKLINEKSLELNKEKKIWEENQKIVQILLMKKLSNFD